MKRRCSPIRRQAADTLPASCSTSKTNPTARSRTPPQELPRCCHDSQPPAAWAPPSIPGGSGNGGLTLTTIRPHRTSAIFQARQRLRPETVAALFDGVAKPLGRPAMSAVWLAGRRLVAIDGSWLVAADGVKNSVFLGARGQQQREAGVPAGVYSRQSPATLGLGVRTRSLRQARLTRHSGS